MSVLPDTFAARHFDGATSYSRQSLNLNNTLLSGNIDGFYYGAAPFDSIYPSDQGAAFDFLFDDVPLAPGQNITFNMYYGAASDSAQAERALRAVRSQVYALARGSNAPNQCTDASTVFIMAFNGVGGYPLEFNLFPTTVPSAQPSDFASSAPSTEPSAQPSHRSSLLRRRHCFYRPCHPRCFAIKAKKNSFLLINIRIVF